MEYRLTEGETQWIELLLKSTTAVREKLLAHDTLEDKELYELINRADALIWHLAKRDTLRDEIRDRIAQAVKAAPTGRESAGGDDE